MTRNDKARKVRFGSRRVGTVFMVLPAVLSALLLTAPISSSASSAGTDSSSDAAPRPAQVLWKGDMEEGSLVDWEVGTLGGVFNSGSAEAVASNDFARSGASSARLSVVAPPESGARLFRWGESRANRDLYYEAWLYLPEAYQLTGDPATGEYLNLFQFKSISEDGSQNDPIWFLNVITRPDGTLAPEVVWWSNTLEGPREGELGYDVFEAPGATLPVGRWFLVKARVRQSKDFDGFVQFWVDGQKVFDMRNVRTGYPNCTYNEWCVEQHWSVNLYSDGLSPSPAVMYVDDARIRRPGRCRAAPGDLGAEA